MPERKFDPGRVTALLEPYPPGDPSGLIHVLQDIQAELGHVPCHAAEMVCEHMGIPISRLFAVATFYRALSLEPKGDLIIRICTGTACHIRGAQILVDEVTTELGIGPGQTTEDLRFTFETVNCVGACAMAPVVSLGSKFHGNVQPGTVLEKVGGKS